MPDRTSRPKMLWAGLSSSGIQATREHEKFSSSTADHWTSVSKDNYLGVTAHFIDNVWKLRSFALEVKKTEARHTAENCAEEFIDVSNRWEISDKLTTLGTDIARNMLAAAKLLPF